MAIISNFGGGGSNDELQIALNAHLNDQENPHKATAEQIGADPAGSADAVQDNLDAHIADKGNPHETTKEQLGIYISSEAPTDENASIWIDLDDEPTESYYTKEEIDERFATKDETVLTDGSNEMIGNLAINRRGARLRLYNSAEVTNSAELQLGNNLAYLIAKPDISVGNTYRSILLRDSVGASNLANAISLFDSVEGAIAEYPILHSGNFSTYAAPAGFGWGENSKALNSNHDLATLPAVNARYYWTTYTPANAPVFMGDANYGCVETFVDNGVIHLIARSQYTGAEQLVQTAYIKGGTLSPWEWVNPPMQLGVEYRTTERYNGKAVYKKAIGELAIPDHSTAASVGGRVDGVTGIVDAHALVSVAGAKTMVVRGVSNNPYTGTELSLNAYNENTAGLIYLTTPSNWTFSNGTVVFVVKYTKD